MGKGGYGTIGFWEEWYQEEDHCEKFDWLLEYEEIGAALEFCLGWNHDSNILITGCGNSMLSSELFALGYRNLISIDNCPGVVSAQRLRYPMLNWEIRDVRATGLADNTFDFILDKGCLDNLYCYLSPEENVKKYMRECARLLRPGGRFFLVSCHDAETTAKSLNICSDLWIFACQTFPNPRWPRIQIEHYQLALCQLILPQTNSTIDEEKGKNLAFFLKEAISRLSSHQDEDHNKNESLDTPIHLLRHSSTPPIPARVQHLEYRSSGLRHSSLIIDGSSANNSSSSISERVTDEMKQKKYP
uniref:Methyltransferase type 11 domain-containing protein n=1 Tax=Aureoumbra lagunensis TaxID=44058 RepID=A0A7S3NK83_9STRA|mmetsp:Transcript_8161/g.11369  ORF Transcript_8161/g.11369 Transcript_8161/m.11369 type:complete len:302 (-) Transcript_8161:79-984(-)